MLMAAKDTSRKLVFRIKIIDGKIRLTKVAEVHYRVEPRLDEDQVPDYFVKVDVVVQGK